jgi:hypothetical protein
MTSARLAHNAKIGAKKSKATRKKASTPSSAGGDDAESSAPRKSKAKAKESDNVILDIDEALRHGDKLSTKPSHRISTRFIVPSRSGWQITSRTRRTGFMAHSILSVSTLPPTQ